MDHEVVPRPCKIYDWLLNSSQDYFGLHQGKNVRVIMKFEVPKRHVLRPIHWHGPMGFAVGEAKRCSSRKRRGPIVEKCCYNASLMKFCLGKRKWRQEKTREWSNFDLLFQNYPFRAYIQKIFTFTSWCMVIPLGPRSVCNQWRAQRLCKFIF